MDRNEERERLIKSCELMEKIASGPFLVLDTETTGLTPGVDEVLQFSALDGEEKEPFDIYFKPVKHTSWPEAEAIHHIGPDVVEDCPTIAECASYIADILVKYPVIVGYNVSYDINMLRGVGVQFPQVRYFDVMKAFARIYGEWNDYRQSYKWQQLSVCAEYYGYESKEDENAVFHNSMEDVRATLFCFKEMARTARETIDNWI